MATSSTLSASAAITTSTATPGQTTPEPNKLLTSTAAPETTTQMPSNAAPTTTPAATTMAAASACDGPGGLEVSQRMNLDEGRLQYLCQFLFLSSSSSLSPSHSLAVIPLLVRAPPLCLCVRRRERAHTRAREREREGGREGGRERERAGALARSLYPMRVCRGYARAHARCLVRVLSAGSARSSPMQASADWSPHQQTCARATADPREYPYCSS